MITSVVFCFFLSWANGKQILRSIFPTVKFFLCYKDTLLSGSTLIPYSHTSPLVQQSFFIEDVFVLAGQLHNASCPLPVHQVPSVILTRSMME